jgi:glycine/D-amino acid oxidase-like deaminating enzyme
VGGGYTGLWTAYYLAVADPTLRVAVLEADVTGFGASGRNGGWCSALFPASLGHLARLPGSSRSAALAQHAAMRGTVDEVLRVAEVEGIDAHAAKGGTIVPARTGVQWRRARADVEDARSWGRGEDDVALLSAAEAEAVLAATRTRGATYTPDCATIHPARLVRGSRRRSSGTAWPCTSEPGSPRSSRAGRSPSTAPSRPTSCSGRPRGTPPRCPGTGGRWRRCTR